MGFHPFGKWSTFMVAKLHIYVNVYPRVSLNVPHLSLFTSTNISLKSWKITRTFHHLPNGIPMFFLVYPRESQFFPMIFRDKVSLSAGHVPLGLPPTADFGGSMDSEKRTGMKHPEKLMGLTYGLLLLGHFKVEAMVFWDREIDWGRPTSVKVKHSTTVLDLRKIFSHHLENLLSDWEYVFGFCDPFKQLQVVLLDSRTRLNRVASTRCT